MKLSPLSQMKLAAVLAAATALLGCEAPESSAGEQTPAIYPAVITPPPAPAGPSLVTVSNATAPPTIAAEGLQPVGAERAAEQTLAAEPPAAPVKLSERLEEVVKLAQSGVGDDVILAFIQNSPVAFSPTPEEIVYLTDLGLSDVVITALVNHQGIPPVANNESALAPVNPGMPPNGQPSEAPVATYNPEPQVVYSSPPVVQYVAPQPEVEYSYFYTSLSPYGSWVQMSDYGWCWQPTVAVVHRDWRPYADRGRWLSTDGGWYWQSDYSWGWAPFHYGRWFNHPARGWCWRPDSVWAPAWVSWRYTDSHCGWAPLPPGARFHEHSGFTYYGAHVGVNFGFGLHHDAWTFVSARHVHAREVWRHRVPPSEHRALYRNSRVVNNYVVNNNTIVNRGVTRDHVPALPRSEIRKIAVRDGPQRGGAPFRPDQSGPGTEVVAYRPKAVEAAQPQNGRGPGGNGGRTIASQPGAGSRPGASPVNNVAPNPGGGPARGGEGRTRVEAPGGDGAGTRPNRGIGAAPGSAAPRSLEERPNQSTAPAAVTARPSTSFDTLRPTAAGKSAPSTVTTGELVGPQNGGRVTTTPSVAPRIEPSRTPNIQSPAVQASAPVTPGAQPLAPSVARQEVPKTTPTAPERSAPAMQTYRSPQAGSARSWEQGPSTVPSTRSFQRPTPAAPQVVAQPAPAVRQELPKTSSFVAPERNNNSYSAPARPVQSQRVEPAPSSRTPSANTFSLPTQSRPAQAAPSYSPPVQSRPAQVAPSYSPPVQSRPARSYSAPIQSRPAQVAPSYSAPSRPVPSYSAPVQSRPTQAAPSYSPPVQARPNPSYSTPVQSRPAQQAAPSSPAPSRSAPAQNQDRSSNRRQF